MHCLLDGSGTEYLVLGTGFCTRSNNAQPASDFYLVNCPPIVKGWKADHKNLMTFLS